MVGCVFKYVVVSVSQSTAASTVRKQAKTGSNRPINLPTHHIPTYRPVYRIQSPPTDDPQPTNQQSQPSPSITNQPAGGIERPVRRGAWKDEDGTRAALASEDVVLTQLWLAEQVAGDDGLGHLCVPRGGGGADGVAASTERRNERAGLEG